MRCAHPRLGHFRVQCARHVRHWGICRQRLCLNNTGRCFCNLGCLCHFLHKGPLELHCTGQGAAGPVLEASLPPFPSLGSQLGSHEAPTLGSAQRFVGPYFGPWPSDLGLGLERGTDWAPGQKGPFACPVGCVAFGPGMALPESVKSQSQSQSNEASMTSQEPWATRHCGIVRPQAGVLPKGWPPLTWT